MEAYSFTAGADYRVFAITMTGFSGSSADTLRGVIASGDTTMLHAKDKDGAIVSASNAGNTIVAIVDVDPERHGAEWDVIAAIGVFTGSFIINCKESGRQRSCGLTNRLKAGEILWSIK